MNLDAIGKIASGAYGDRVFMGFLVKYLHIETDVKLYESIRDNRQPLDRVTEAEWEMWRKVSKKVKPEYITTEHILKELQKRRVDLLMILENQPKGREWLDCQMKLVRHKLGLPD